MRKSHKRKIKLVNGKWPKKGGTKHKYYMCKQDIIKLKNKDNNEIYSQSKND